MKLEQAIQLVKDEFNLDHLIFLDFETFFKSKGTAGNKSLSLTSKTLWEYILGDPRFHITGVGAAADSGEVTYPATPDSVDEAVRGLRETVRSLRSAGKRIALVAHNTAFDGAVAAWSAGITFDFYICTQLIEKLLNVHLSASLAKTAKRYFPDDEGKGTQLANVDGVPLSEFTQEQHDDIAVYCIQDTNLMRRIFAEQMDHFDRIKDELELMNITLRAGIEPQFVTDRPLLGEVIEESSENAKKTIMDAVRFCHEKGIQDVAPATFSSNQKYCGLLQLFNVEVPAKTSPTTGKPTPALGQNDPEYVQMQIKHPELDLIYKARKIAKSNQAKTRAESLITCSKLLPVSEMGQDLPLFLNYYGAENTGRWSGGQRLNQQNLQRKSKHRLSLRAPAGYVVAVSDLSNIELRVNLWFCEQQDLLAEYDRDPKFDMYSSLASDIYGFAVNKDDNPDERQIGKAGSLGLGYAMGWFGFQGYLAGGPLGMEPMFVSDSFARQVKNSYDAKHYKIRAMWEFINRYVIPAIRGDGEDVYFGPNGCVVARKDQIELPSGRILRYPNCRAKMSGDDRGYRTQTVCDGTPRRGQKFAPTRNIWHGLILENIIQALSRDVLAHQKVMISRDIEQYDWGWVIGSVHDEVLAMLRAEVAEKGFALMQKHMSEPPPWGKGIPLDNEGGYDVCYSK